MSEDEGAGFDGPNVAMPDIPDLDDLTLIGRGGFCRVFAALDPEFGRRVAVKVFPPQDDEGVRRIERERLLMGRMSMHPNVVTPYRYGETASGLGYLVMEYLPGGSLDQMVGRSGPVQWPEAVELMDPVLDALAAAHDLGIVHRDVKPGNVLLTADGETKLTDFGIAQIRSGTDGNDGFSLAYCAPEAFGDGTDRRDERSDLYSLAATLFYLVTGRAPFAVDGEDSIPAYLRRVEGNAVPPVGSLALDAFFRRALAKDPSERPQTVADLRSSMLAAAGRSADQVSERPDLSDDEVWVAPLPLPTPAATDPTEPGSILADDEVDSDADSDVTVHPVGGGSPSVDLPSIGAGSERDRSNRRFRLMLIGVAAALVVVVLGLGFVLGPSFWPGEENEASSGGGNEAAAGPSASSDGGDRSSVTADVDPSTSASSPGSTATSSSIPTSASTSTLPSTSSPGSPSTSGSERSTVPPSSSDASTTPSSDTAPASITGSTARASTTRSPASSPATTPRRSTTTTTRPSTTRSTERTTTTADRADEAFRAGVASFNAGRIEESIGHLDRAATLDPDHPEVFIYRSLAHRVAGRFGQAVADGERAIDNAPNNGDAYLQRGIALAADGRPAAALIDLDRADRLKPRSVVVLLNRGVVNADLGNLTQARADFTAVISIDSSNADAHWHRGRVNGRLDRNDQALADLERFVDLATPSDGRLPEARRLIAELRDGDDPFDQV